MEEKIGRTQESRKRREELAKLVTAIGIYGLPDYSQLAHQYGVSKMQISKDFKAILKNMPKLDYEEVRASIEASLKSSYKVAVQLLMRAQHEDASTIQKAVSTYLAVIHELTNYLSLIKPEKDNGIKFIIETIKDKEEIKGKISRYKTEEQKIEQPEDFVQEIDDTEEEVEEVEEIEEPEEEEEDEISV